MKKYLLWIAELFVWLLILFLVSSVILFAKYNYKRSFNTYQIFLPDVDGLINGSPVKIMGIQVGYVNQIDIVGDEVYVKFIITDSNVKIAYGSTATVEFSGLGGSKSLELYPPVPGKQSNKFIVVQSPKRIHDSLGLLNEMFSKIIDITYTVSNFIDKLGMIKIEQQKSVDKFLESSNCWLDKALKKCDKFNKELKKRKESKNNGKNYEQNK